MRRRLDRDLRAKRFLQLELKELPRGRPGRRDLYRREIRAFRNRQRRRAIREGLAEATP